MDIDIKQHDGHITMTIDNYKLLRNQLEALQKRVYELSDPKKLISDEYLDVQEASRLLKVCTKTIERNCAKGLIPRVEVGRRVFYRKSHLELFMLIQDEDELRKILEEKGK